MKLKIQINRQVSFFDNIDIIETNVIKCDPKRINGIDKFIFETNTIENKKPIDKEIEFLLLHLTKSNGSLYSILTTKPVYVLNDNGKTIDKFII